MKKAIYILILTTIISSLGQAQVDKGGTGDIGNASLSNSIKKVDLQLMEVDPGAVHSVLQINSNLKLIQVYVRGQTDLLKHLCISYLRRSTSALPARWSSAECFANSVSRVLQTTLSNGNKVITVRAIGKDNKPFELRNVIGQQAAEIID